MLVSLGARGNMPRALESIAQNENLSYASIFLFFFFNLENSIRKLPIHMSGMVSLYVEHYILHLKQVRTLNDLK